MVRWWTPRWTRWIWRTLTVLRRIKRKAVRRTPIGVPPPAMKRCLMWMKLKIWRMKQWIRRLERQCQRPRKRKRRNMSIQNMSLRQSRQRSCLPNFKWHSERCSAVLDVNLWWVSMALQLQLRSCFSKRYWTCDARDASTSLGFTRAHSSHVCVQVLQCVYIARIWWCLVYLS